MPPAIAPPLLLPPLLAGAGTGTGAGPGAGGGGGGDCTGVDCPVVTLVTGRPAQQIKRMRCMQVVREQVRAGALQRCDAVCATAGAYPEEFVHAWLMLRGPALVCSSCSKKQFLLQRHKGQTNTAACGVHCCLSEH